jgi:hypothetical protein
LDGLADRKFSRRLGERTSCNEDAPSGADPVHGCRELANAWDTNLIDEPVFALDQDGVLTKQDKVVAAISAAICRLFDEIPLSSVDFGNRIFESPSAQFPDGVQRRAHCCGLKRLSRPAAAG